MTSGIAMQRYMVFHLGETPEPSWGCVQTYIKHVDDSMDARATLYLSIYAAMAHKHRLACVIAQH